MSDVVVELCDYPEVIEREVDGVTIIEILEGPPGKQGPPGTGGGGGGGEVVWGSITGTLGNQTDLVNALAGKSDVGHTHTLSALTQSGAAYGQVPKWNGSAWVAAYDDTGAGGVEDGDKGDVTVTDDGETWTINAGAVTYAKMQEAGARSVLCRSANSGGALGEVQLANNQVMMCVSNALVGALVNTNQMADLAVSTTKLANLAVTYGKMQNVNAYSVVGRASNSSGIAAAISAGTANQVLRRGDVLDATLGFGAINLSSSDAVTGALALARLAQSGATTGQVMRWTGSEWAPGNTAPVEFDVGCTLEGGGSPPTGGGIPVPNRHAGKVVATSIVAADANGNRVEDTLEILVEWIDPAGDVTDLGIVSLTEQDFVFDGDPGSKWDEDEFGAGGTFRFSLAAPGSDAVRIIVKLFCEKASA